MHFQHFKKPIQLAGLQWSTDAVYSPGVVVNPVLHSRTQNHPARCEIVSYDQP